MNACIMNTSNHTQMTIAGKSLVSVNFTIDQSAFIKEVHKYACSAKNECRCLQDFEAFAVLVYFTHLLLFLGAVTHSHREKSIRNSDFLVRNINWNAPRRQTSHLESGRNSNSPHILKASYVFQYGYYSHLQGQGTPHFNQ